ncbi:DUF211 domain-containing protein [Candidatus Altiarchaeota archaeon]
MNEDESCTSPVRVLVLDILKPHKPNIVEFSKSLCNIEHIDSADITVYAVDEKTESLKMTIEGDDIDFDKLKFVIEEQGGAVHSIDKVISGKRPSYHSHTTKVKSEQVSI